MTPSTQHARRSALAHLVIAFAVVALATAAALVPTTGAQAQQRSASSSGTGWIRVGHLSPGTPDADIVLTPFAGGRAITLHGVGYGDVSDFTRAPVGVYTLSMVRSGAGPTAKPMLSRSVRVTEGAAKTVVATGSARSPRVQVLDDDLSAPPAGTARVRLVSATSTSTLAASIVGGKDLADDVGPGQATGYADVPAQTWAVQVSTTRPTDGSTADPKTLTSRVKVLAGSVNTLFVLDTPTGLRLEPVMDSTGSRTTPSGGVDTGGGGLASAASRTGSDSTALLALPAGSALVLGALLVLSRRRPDRDRG